MSASRQEQVGAAIARRFGRDVGIERARSRTSAYVYGNILVLAAVVAMSPQSVDQGRAAVVVLATTATTYLAHVVAHMVGDSVGRDHSVPHPPGEAVADLRDAVPILSSGSLPAMILAVAWWTQLDAGLAIALAALTVILRLAGIGILAARLSGLPPSGRQLASGLVLAVTSLVIVLLKVTLTH